MLRFSRSLTQALVAALALSYAGSAFALVDAQLMYGRRWVSAKSGDDSGSAFSHTMVAAHLGLLPIVSVGASVSLFDMIAADKDSNDLDTAKGTEIGLDVMAALSFVPIVTPYARVNLPLVSTYELKGDGRESKSEGVPLQSYWFSAGIKYPIIPLFSVNAEVGTGERMSKLTKLEVNGVDELKADKSNKNRKAFKTDEFLLGVEFNF